MPTPDPLGQRGTPEREAAIERLREIADELAKLEVEYRQWSQRRQALRDEQRDLNARVYRA